MKKLILLIGILVLTIQLKAQSQFSASADVTATIVKSILIEKITDLKFGKIVTGSTASEVQIQLNNTRSVASGNATLFNQTNDHQVAIFKTSGSPNATYYIVFPQSVSITGPTGSDPMTVDGFVHSATGVLDYTGEETFNVGATLNIGANQASGDYTGSFTVTVAYN